MTDSTCSVFILQNVRHYRYVSIPDFSEPFDLLATEGRNDRPQLAHILVNPVFGIFLFLYFYVVLRFIGKDAENIKRLEKRFSLSQYKVDLSVSELVDASYPLFGWILAGIIAIFFALSVSWPSIVVGLFLGILYGGVIVYLTLQTRNEVIVKRVLSRLSELDGRRALVYAGKNHVQGLKALFEANGAKVVLW